MKTWVRRHWRSGLIVLVSVGVIGTAAILLWRLLTTPFQGTAEAARVTVGGLALIGVLATATITLIGLVLKQTIDRRDQQRLKLETAVQAIKLMSLEDGKPASKAQVSAALLVLAKLGEIALAVDVAAELWPNKQITSSAAVRIIEDALIDKDRYLQREAAVLLLNNVLQLDVAKHQQEWPKCLDTWPSGLDAEARATIALALWEWIRGRPGGSEDFRVELLSEAREKDSDQRVQKVIRSAIEKKEN